MSIDLKRDPMEKENNLEKETKETKTFFQDSFRIDYQNSSKIYYSQETNCVEVKVNNYLCYQQGQNLYKITEIIYNDKIIRIEDKLQVSIDSVNLGESCSLSQGKNENDGKNLSRTIEKVRIFNKNTNKGTKLEKKDKKNIVKNIVKLFVAWLENKESEKLNSHYENSLRELKIMMESENFNNRLIQKIITSIEVNKSFLEFVEESAEDEIKYSRIQDKESHYEALEIYKNLLTKRHNNVGAIASNSEASEQSESPRELNNSSGSQENLSSSENFNGSSRNSKEAGFKIKSPCEGLNKIIVIQNEIDKKQ